MSLTTANIHGGVRKIFYNTDEEIHNFRTIKIGKVIERDTAL